MLVELLVNFCVLYEKKEEVWMCGDELQRSLVSPRVLVRRKREQVRDEIPML